MSIGKYVDISSHNGTPDLQAYWNAGHRDLMLKATEGTGYYWPQMQALARQWHTLGGRCGYYHWLYGTFTGQAQFDWFWQHVEPVFQPGDWLMDDFEDVDPSRWVSDAKHLIVVRDFDRLCDQKAETHDYAPNWYVASMPLCTAYFKSRNVVPSDYSHTPALNPHGFTYVAHQFTDRATVAGFASPVDYNTWLINPATTGDDSMSAADVAALKAYIDSKTGEIADAVMTKLLLTDGPLNSPTDAADHATNPNWAWKTHIEATTTAARAANTNAHAVLTELSAPTGVLARLAQIQNQLATSPTVTGGGADLAPVLTAVADIHNILTNLAAHLGATA